MAHRLNTNKQFMVGNGILAFAVIFVVVIFVYMSLRLDKKKDEDRNFIETYTITLTKGFVGDSLSLMINDSVLVNKKITEEPFSIDVKRFAEQSALLIVDNETEKLSLFELSERGGTYRFEKENENMTEMPEQEGAIFFKLGNKEAAIPAGKTVIEYELPELWTPDGERILAENIFLRIRGSEKICITGKNGVGKTTLLHKIAEELLNRNDIHAEYMPQNYEELLQLHVTPVEYLDQTGKKEERTKIRTFLGALKYTADEMDHPIAELSGGQKAKIFLLKMSMSGANVLILDEPTRNFSPLSGPVIREMLKEFPGAVISISHDRKYIDEVCDKVYCLTETGLQLQEK